MIDGRLDVRGGDVVERDAKALVDERVGLDGHRFGFGAGRA
jgi:hypothetical protein